VDQVFLCHGLFGYSVYWKIVTLQVTSSSRDVIVELAVLSATDAYFASSLLTLCPNK